MTLRAVSTLHRVSFPAAVMFISTYPLTPLALMAAVKVSFVLEDRYTNIPRSVQVPASFVTEPTFGRFDVVGIPRSSCR
jgi:hypothetical protein